MRTNPEEFKAFHELLTKGRPDYIPHYFKLKPNDKDPDVRGSWKESRLTFEQAYELMKLGSNIGIAGTDADDLVIIDLDRPGIEDVKPTLRVKSRKRQGWHNFYFTKDPKCKKNIPTEEDGEVRTAWQYVVATGSFVPLEQEKIDKLPPPERELAGCYTLENRVPPADLIFDELPAVFKMLLLEQEKLAEEPEKKKINFKSGLWKLNCRDIFKDAPPPYVRWASPFHESETGKNTSMSSQGLIHCWRHNVSLTAIQTLAVLSGEMSCLDAGEGHAGSGAGPSKLDLKNKDLVRKIWAFAKTKNFLPEHDADPYQIERRGTGKPGAKGEKTVDVELIIEAGLYHPDAGPAYDQFVHAVGICTSKQNEKMLWALARAARFIGEPAMARLAAAEALLINNHFITEADLAKPEIYWYDVTTGIYRTNGRHQIAALIDAQVPDCSTDLKQNVVEKIMGKTRKPIQELKPPKWLICLQNGILNIENGQLEAYSPDHFFLSRFNVKYDADAKCPLFQKFLTEVLLPEDIPTMEEAIGYLLEKGMPFHVMFFLLGEGRNGKGVLMYVLQQFVGLDGFSAKGLEGLASPLGFDRAYLHGKIANFSGEVTDKPLRHVGMLKQLSGGDMVDGDRKFLSSVKWMNEAKLWFSMNIPPFTREITRAWWARIIIFEFPNIFMPGAPQTIPNLQEQLMTEQELSGILNLALDGRQRLMKRGWFSYTKTMENVEDLWLTAADTVHGWLGEVCEEDREYSQELTKDDLYESYSVYCKKKKLASQARNMFFERLKQLCPWIREKRVRAGTERVSVITGLRVEGLNALIRDERQQQLPMSQPVIGIIETNPDRLLATPSGQGGQGYSPLYLHEEENEEKRSNNGNNDTYVKGVQTTPTTLTKPPNSDCLAPPVRVQIASPKSISIKPKAESVIVESAEELQKALLDLQAKVTPQSLEHEFLILQWALEVAMKNISAGDRVGAYLLRAEGMRKFTDQANSVARIIDTFYFEIEGIAKRIVARKKSLQTAS